MLLYLIIVTWLILPIVLIPMSISERKKKEKLERFLNELKARGRISAKERVTLTPEEPPAAETVPEGISAESPAERPAEETSRQGFTAYTAPAAYVPRESVTAEQAHEEKKIKVPVHRQENKTAADISGRRHTDPAAVLLGIGSALIILAGLVFSTMNWTYMTDIQRTGMIALASVFFFAVGLFSLKKLKLDNTGMAFYLLGSAFASITFLTAGCFGLMGEWLSVSGGGLLMLMSLTTLILTGSMAAGLKLFGRGGFFHAALYGGLISFLLMSLQLIDDREWWTFAMNLAAAVPIYFISKQRYGKDEHSGAVKLFCIITASVLTFTAIPYMLGMWEIPGILTALLWLAQAYAYGFIHSGTAWLKYLHIILAEIILFEGSAMFTEPEGCALATGIGSFLLAAAYRHSPWIRTKLSDYLPSGVMALCAAVLLTEADTSAYGKAALILALVCALSAYFAVTEETAKAHRYLLPLMTAGFAQVLSLFAYTSVSWISRTYFGLQISFALILFLLALVIRYPGRLKLRSAVSDTVFPTVLTLMTMSFYYYNSPDAGLVPMMPLAFAVVLLMTCIFGSDRISISAAVGKRILPFALVGTAMVSYRCACENGEVLAGVLVSFIICCALFAALRFIPMIRTETSDFLIPLSAANICLALMNDHGIGGEALTPVFFALLSVMLITSGHGKNAPVYTIIHRICAPLPMFAAAVACEELYRAGTGYTDYSDTVYLPAVILTAAFAAVSTLLARRAKDERRFGYVQSQYIWTAAAGIMTLMPLAEKSHSYFAVTACMLINIFLYLLSAQHKNDLTSVVNVVMICVFGNMLYEMYDKSHTSSDGWVLCVVMTLLSVLMISGRRLFPNGIICRENGALKADTAAFGVFIAAGMMLTSNTGMSDNAIFSMALLLSAAGTANLIRRDTPAGQRKILLTAASGMLCMLVWTRPFLISDVPAVNAKINLLPLLMFSAAVRYIWREQPDMSAKASFIINISAMVFLMYDALTYQSLANTIFIMAVVLCIMLWAFWKKNAKWFAVSAASLSGMTLYITRDFLGRLEWWAYLLIAGVILVTAAAVNEYLKSRGMTAKDLSNRIKERWQR